MSRLLLLLLALALGAPAGRAQGALEVKVCAVDEDDGAPLEDVWVRAREGSGPASEGTTGTEGCVWLLVPLTTAGEDGPAGAEGLAVGPAFPNPAADAVRVPVTLGVAQSVEWRLYDLLGRLVRGPEEVALPAGRHALALPLDGLPEGRYAYRIAGRGGAAGGTLVKGPAAGPARTVAASAVAGPASLTFEAWRAGYDTLRTTRTVLPGETATLRLAKQRGPGRPITDMAPGEAYLGFEGGLYPGVANTPPDRHDSAGVARGWAVVPRDAAGNPSPSGRYVLLSIGFSNTTEEFCGENTTGGPPCQPWSFVGQAASDPAVDHGALAMADGARGGQPLSVWLSAASPEYDRIRDRILAPKGLSEAQVQVVWLKVTTPFPATSLPHPGAEAYQLVGHYGQILRALRARYPHLQQVFLSSRNWGGYATTPLHPEPYAYESGYAVKWVVGAQIAQMDGGGVDPRAGDLDYDTVAPWAAWGPYLWAEGLRPRADGLWWGPSAFEADGTHPGRIAEELVGVLLLDFFKTSPYTRCWFVRGGTCGD